MSYDTASFYVDKIITTVKRQFGDESGVQIDNSDIIRWINDGQREISVQLAPLRGRATTTLAAGQKVAELPTQNVVEVSSITIDGIKLPFKNFQEAMADMKEPNATGHPQYYYSWGKEFMFWPIPDKEYTLEVFYSRYPAEVMQPTDKLTIPDRFYDSLVSYVMSKAAELDEEFDVMQNHKADFAARIVEQQDAEMNAQQSLYPTMTFF